MAAWTSHENPHVRHVAPVTLWEIFESKGGTTDARRAPLAVALLSDENVALLEHAFQMKAAAKLRALAPAAEDLVVGRCDALANALIHTALDRGRGLVLPKMLASANKHIIELALTRLSAEQSDGAKWRDFLAHGERVGEGDRPGNADTDERGARKETQRALFGYGATAFNPWDRMGADMGLIDHYMPMLNMTPRQFTGSDDMRSKVVPWAGPAVDGFAT